MRPEHIGDAPIEALDHPVGTGCSWSGEAVLDAQVLTELVKLMPARGITGPAAKEPVREFLAIIGENLADPDRARLVQRSQKGARTGRRLVGFDLHKHPARGPVDRYEQVTPALLIGHLRQILDVHMHIARNIALERLVRGRLGLRLEGVEIAHAMPAQTAIEPGAGHLAAEEFPGDGKQVIQGKQQRAPQVHDDGFLGRCEVCLQVVRESTRIL